MELLGVAPICGSAVGASMSKLKEVKMLLDWDSGGIWLVRSGLKNGLFETTLSTPTYSEEGWLGSDGGGNSNGLKGDD